MKDLSALLRRFLADAPPRQPAKPPSSTPALASARTGTKSLKSVALRKIQRLVVLCTLSWLLPSSHFAYRQAGQEKPLDAAPVVTLQARVPENVSEKAAVPFSLMARLGKSFNRHGK